MLAFRMAVLIGVCFASANYTEAGIFCRHCRTMTGSGSRDRVISTRGVDYEYVPVRYVLDDSRSLSSDRGLDDLANKISQQIESRLDDRIRRVVDQRLVELNVSTGTTGVTTAEMQRLQDQLRNCQDCVRSLQRSRGMDYGTATGSDNGFTSSGGMDTDLNSGAMKARSIESSTGAMGDPIF